MLSSVANNFHHNRLNNSLAGITATFHGSLLIVNFTLLKNELELSYTVFTRGDPRGDRSPRRSPRVNTPLVLSIYDCQSEHFEPGRPYYNRPIFIAVIIFEPTLF